MLAIRDLCKTYANGVHALNRVDLDIPRGMFGLLGPNGAGKSSLMRTLATLQEADSGAATLEGPDGKPIDVLRDKDAVRRQLGYLPQDFGVYPKVSAEDLLEHFAVLKGLVDRKQRREVVDGLRHHVTAGDPVVTVTVDETPYEAGFDPYNKLIDRVADDNRKRVSVQ